MSFVMYLGRDAVCQIFGTLKIVKTEEDLVAVVCYLERWRKDHMSSLFSWCLEMMDIPYSRHETYMHRTDYNA